MKFCCVCVHIYCETNWPCKEASNGKLGIRRKAFVSSGSWKSRSKINYLEWNVVGSHNRESERVQFEITQWKILILKTNYITEWGHVTNRIRARCGTIRVRSLRESVQLKGAFFFYKMAVIQTRQIRGSAQSKAPPSLLLHHFELGLYPTV